MKLLKEYQTNTQSFIELIKDVPDKLFNTKLNKSTWSVAENIEHIIRSEFGTARLFTSATEEDLERNSEAKINEIRTRFLDRSENLQAFGVVLPTEGDKTKDELIQKFKASRAQVSELIETQNLDEICMRFEHPLFGHMTRWEWINFNIVHTERHMLQIKQLLENLSKM